MGTFFKNMRLRNRILLGMGAAVILGVIVILGNRGRANSNRAFQTSELQRGALTATVGATGSVRASQSAILNWQTSGTVEQSNVAVGDRVRKGEVLAALAQDSVPQSVIQAQASLVTAQRELQNALSKTASAQAAINLKDAQEAYKKAYDYRLSLNAKQWIQDVRIRYVRGQQVPEIRWFKGYVDAPTIQEADNTLALRKAELDDAQREFDRLKDGPNPDDIAAAQANVDAAQAILNTAKIIAPIDGTVTQAGTLPGDQVIPGRLAYRIDDLSGLLVDVEVSEVDINDITAGQPATLTLDAISNVTYHGQVEEVYQAGDLSAGAVNFLVTVRITDADKNVKPGMTAAVNIIVKQLQDQLLVPNRAVRLVDGERVVYILKDGKSKQVQIILGASSDTVSVLTSGDLKEGDLIILNPPSPRGGPFGGGPGG